MMRLRDPAKDRIGRDGIDVPQPRGPRGIYAFACETCGAPAGDRCVDVEASLVLPAVPWVHAARGRAAQSDASFAYGRNERPADPVCIFCGGYYEFPSPTARGVWLSVSQPREVFTCWECAHAVFDKLTRQVSSRSYAFWFDTVRNEHKHQGGRTDV